MRGFPGSLPAAAQPPGDALHSAQVIVKSVFQILGTEDSARVFSSDGPVPGGLRLMETQS